ncbi:MAG: bifunctional (p)ppGpp synthetase/guanosine-3',5'-bis(diphosphate) 3'-pyrophosphohydrolase [Pseudomonadota bacterium]|nr:bifunctional (p)ppGpp synthetase/guanosine-3',5'-bis(diphosphate) 3'-pyrophosphohydrolase [Pseudomonadota bacterium]
MVSVSKRLPEEHLDDDAIDAWLALLPPAEDADIRAKLSEAAHSVLGLFAEQEERSGQQLALYVLHVADILAQFDPDDSTLIAAILHRTLSANIFDHAALLQRYGETVAHCIQSLDKIHQLTPGVLSDLEEKGEAHSENLRRLLLGLSSDVRVIMIMLAERVHLMRRQESFSESNQHRFSRNTLDIFAPLANRLGIWQIKWELEDLSLRYLHPGQYREIAIRLEERRDERLASIKSVIKKLDTVFEEQGIHAQMSGRPKHIYSIWRKMQRKDMDFSHIFDVRAVRVLVDSITECYSALGIVHGLWRHIPQEFDDYIATPKANLYQSIHTVVIGDDERPLEIQIRTHDMHEHAERGVAAHWRYKEQRGENRGLEQRIEWMRQWLEQRDDIDEQSQLQSDDEQQHIYVLTPQGKVIELGYGATPIDFAYAIHTSVGHRCRGAKVDGRITQLTQPLQNGQTVEIMTARQERPSRDWMSSRLGYVRSSRARGRIRQWFRQQDYDTHVEAGKESLERETMRLGAARANLSKIARHFNMKSDEALYAAIGRGDISPVQVASWELRQQQDSAKPAPKPRRKQQPGKAPQLIVQGVDDLLTQLGQCCKPVPGDDVTGYITRGRGITIHRRDCSVVQHMSEEEQQRLIDVEWESDESDSGEFKVDIRVIALDRKGLFRDISAIFSNEEVDITTVRTHTNPKKHQAVMRFTVEISDVSQLQGLLDKLNQSPDVIKAMRAT